MALSPQRVAVKVHFFYCWNQEGLAQEPVSASAPGIQCCCRISFARCRCTFARCPCTFACCRISFNCRRSSFACRCADVIAACL